MLAFLSLVQISRAENFCFKAENVQGECSEGYTVIKDITEMYPKLKKGAETFLEVINNEDSKITVEAKELNNAKITFKGFGGSIMDLVYIETNNSLLDSLGIRDISLNFVAPELLRFKTLYLNNSKLAFSTQYKEIKANEIYTDLQTISYFDFVNVTKFELRSVESAPVSELTVLVRSVMTMNTPIYKDSNCVIGQHNLTLSYEGIDINIDFAKEASASIYHRGENRLHRVYVENVPKTSDIDTSFKFYATAHSRLEIEYKTTLAETSPTVYAYLSNGATLYSPTHNSAVSIFIEGDATLDLKDNRNDCSFLGLSIPEDALLTIDNTEQITKLTFTSHVAFKKHGSIIATNPITISSEELSFDECSVVENFGTNIKFSVWKLLWIKEASVNVPYIELKQNAKIEYSYKIENCHDYSGINVENFVCPNANMDVDMLFLGNQIPNDEQAKQLVDKPATIISSPQISSDKWRSKALSEQSIRGFFGETSLVIGVSFNDESGRRCFGVKLEDTPMHVFPRFCYAADKSYCGSSYFISKETAGQISSYVQDSAREIEFTFADQMPSDVALDFAGLKRALPVSIKAVLPTSNVYLHLTQNVRSYISALTLVQGVFTFTGAQSVELDYLEINSGASFSNETKKLSFDNVGAVAISLQSIHDVDASMFKNAVIPIEEATSVSFHARGWSFSAPGLGESVDVSYEERLPLFVTGLGSLSIAKSEDNFNAIKVRQNVKELAVEIATPFAQGDVAVELISDAAVLVNSASPAIPIAFSGRRADVVLVGTLGTQLTKFGIAPQLFRNAYVAGHSKVAGVSMYFKEVTIGGNVTYNAKIEIDTLKVLPETTAIIQAKIHHDFTIPINASVSFVDADLGDANVIVVTSPVEKGGVLGLTHVSGEHLPKSINVDWTASKSPAPGSEVSRIVVPSMDADIGGIVSLTRLSRKVEGKNVVAHLEVSSVGAAVVFKTEDVSTSNNILILVGVGIAGFLLAICFAAIFFVCKQRHERQQLKLDQPLLTQT